VTDRAALEAVILRLTRERGADKSICPSEAARVAAPEDWRALMGPVREAAKQLSRQGRIEILRKGKPVDPDAVKGVIRLRIKEQPENDTNEETA